MGLLESLFENANMICNPRYGIIGLFAFPFYILTEIVPPFVEIAGYCILGAGIAFHLLPLSLVYRFLLITWAYSLMHNVVALVMEYYGIGSTLKFHHFLIKLFVSLSESLFYRQLNLFYKLKALFKFFTAEREWGAMERKGFSR